MANGNIIIIGAGAAGLMAAKELCAAGRNVTVLEARGYLGGRIHTLYNTPFTTHVELGAEFVHGDLPVTLGLFKEAGIKHHTTAGEMWQADHGALKQEYRQIPHWDVFEERLKALTHNITINDFLQAYFSGAAYADLREGARRYAAGYDTADPDKASALAVRDEWLAGREDQHKPDNGYQAMIDYLAAQCKANGCAIHTNTAVKQIAHARSSVTVTAWDGKTYTGSKVIITLPIGVLQADDAAQGAITFVPVLPEIKSAIDGMAMGAVIKVLLQFSEAFWEDKGITKAAGKSMEKMGFILSQEAIPTFWTQYPDKNALLTGWLGGPKAELLKDARDEHILRLAIESLANIFSMTPAALTKLLVISKVINWTADPYSKGSYSYATTATAAAREVLATPVADTIYFAGEAMHDSAVMGTVEAALASGIDVARLIVGKG